MDRGVILNNSGDLATVSREEVRGPVSDSTETLDDESAVSDTLRETNFIDESLVGGHLTDSVVNTETSGFGTTTDTTVFDELTSAATFRVDILFTLDVHVGIFDPGHDLFVGSHIGSKAVDSSTDEALLDKFHSVLTGDTFKFSLRKLTRVDLNTALTTTEWNISDSEFESHQLSKSLNFLQINMVRISGTTLAWKLVCGVLRTVASDGAEGAIVHTERDVETNDCLASLNQIQVLLIDAGFGCRVVEV